MPRLKWAGPERGPPPAYRLHRSHPASMPGGLLCLAFKQAEAQYLVHSIASTAAIQTSGSTRVVPLLEPGRHALPFGLALELHSAAEAEGEREAIPLAAAASGRGDPDMYELRYVLAGQGQLLRREGGAEALQAGDTVLMSSGAHPVVAAAAAEAGAVEDSVPLASLVAYIPLPLFELPSQGQEAGGQEAGGGADHETSALASLVQRQWLEGSPAGSLPAEDVAVLLGGARDTARRAMQAGTPPSPPYGQQPTDDSSSRRRRRSSSSSSAAETAAGQLASGLQAATAGVAGALLSWLQRLRAGGGFPTTRRSLQNLTTYQLPNQTNRLALIFDPLAQPPVPFVFGVEVFEAGHRTKPHVHPTAHELFFVLSGSGEGFCNGHRFRVAPGDVVLFRPGSTHGIDVDPGPGRMYCLELMLPNEAFAEIVRGGRPAGGLLEEELCIIASIGCGGAAA